MTDDEGRVQEFDFATEEAIINLNAPEDTEPDFGIESVIAIPIEGMKTNSWSHFFQLCKQTADIFQSGHWI